MAEDLLGPLRGGPVPPFPAGATIRARGEQRRRRRRAAMAGAAVVAVVMAGSTAVALSGVDDGDELRPAPFASAVPTPSTSPSSVPPTPSPPAASAWFLPDVFLTPDEAARAEEPGWVVDEARTPDTLTPAADPCRESTIPLEDRVRDQGEQVMGSKREAGGSSLLQEVYRYDSAGDAGQAFADYEQQYTRCASEPDPNADGEGWTIRSEIRRQELTPAGGSMLVRAIPCVPGGGCTVHFATYTMVVQEAEALTVVAYMIAEDGDPAEAAEALLAAVQERLRQVVSG